MFLMKQEDLLIEQEILMSILRMSFMALRICSYYWYANNGKTLDFIAVNKDGAPVNAKAKVEIFQRYYESVIVNRYGDIVTNLRLGIERYMKKPLILIKMAQNYHLQLLLWTL